MIRFEKVSFEQWAKDMEKVIGEKWYNDNGKKYYDAIKLPRRGTKKAAGYDFFSPISFMLETPRIGEYDDHIINHTVTIPTGIRVKMDDDKVLICFPRSGQGFKYGVELANTAGLIDADYYDAKNEGHIMIRLSLKSLGYTETFYCDAGQAFVQGLFLPYFKTDDDDVDTERTGGLGSTDRSGN